MARRYDVCVVGLGAAGSQAAWQLARRGRRVLGLDRYDPPHEVGSTHGASRIIREAYFEGALYVPLVRRAYDLWEQLERESQTSLLQITGGLWIGDPDGEMVRGCRMAAAEHDVAIRVLDPDAARDEFPMFAIAPTAVAVHERRAGILRPEAAVRAAFGCARAAGADLRPGTNVLGWDVFAGGVRVHTTDGAHEAAQLILAAGPWTAELAPQLAPALTVERQLTVWLRQAAPVDPAMPVWFWDAGPDTASYGFPPDGGLIKLARHHHGEATTPDSVDRAVGDGEAAAVRDLAQQLLGAAAGPVERASVCLYTNTPDEHFAIGPLPGAERVTLVSACSGHGFKFASAVGELAADIADGETPQLDISAFDPARLVAGLAAAD